MFEDLPCGLAIRLVHELGDGKLTRPVDAHEEEKLSLDPLNLGDVDVKEPDWVSLEPLPLGSVAADIRQSRDPFAIVLEPMAHAGSSLKAPVQR